MGLDCLESRSSPCGTARLVDSRSWTDLASNVTHLGGVRLADHLDALLTPGKGPKSILLGCLHELTHHWCFLSSVGVTITALTSRMAGAIVGGENRHEELVLRDLVACRTATALMRPMAEGLALFAEFDINSIRSPIFSRPLAMAASLFSGKAPSVRNPLAEDGNFFARDIPDGLAESLPLVAELRTARLSETGIRRKVNVLATKGDQDLDGYLLGYLGVKGMWRMLRQQCGRLYSETDLAFAFLRNFFFEDRHLVEILITSREERPEDLADRILKHIRGRKDQLADVTEADIDAFESHVLSGTPNQSVAWAPCQHTSAEEWKRGQQAYATLTESLTKPKEMSDSTPEDRFRDDIRNVFSIMLRRRHIIRLGAQDVDVEVDHVGGFVVRRSDRELFRGHAQHATTQSGDGSIELVFSAHSSGLRRAIAVYGPDSLIDIVIPGTTPDDEVEQELSLLRTQLRPSAKFVEFGDGIDRLINSFAAESGIALMLESIQSQIPTIVKYLYLDVGLNAVSDERLHEVIRLLDTGGVYAFLGYERDLLDALIILGAVAPLLPFRRLLLPELAKQGFPNPEVTLAELVQCKERTGLPVVNADEERVFVQI